MLFAARFPATPDAATFGDLAATAERGGVERGERSWPPLRAARFPIPGALAFGDLATGAERAMVDRLGPACFGEGLATGVAFAG